MSITQSSTLNRKHIVLACVLVVFIASIYMITYSGRIESGDTLLQFNAAGSLVRFGDNLLDLSMGAITPDIIDNIELLPQFVGEPLQVILAVPLYWLADKLSNIGLVHTVWLFNIYISASVCGLLFLYALLLGYQERTAVSAALLLGLATIMWPYSKTFFREPLATFLILLTALFTELWRRSGYRSHLTLLGLGLSFVGAFLTKEAIIFALPLLLILLLPDFKPRVGMTWILCATASAMFLSVLVIGVLGIFRGSLRLMPVTQGLGELTGTSSGFINTILIAIHSYLWSIGSSIWGTSPIVLLAIPGGWLLYRQGKGRYVWAAVFGLLTFAWGYALFRGIHWFGGLSWPPRFLIPIVPFLIIAALPIIDRLFARYLRWWSILLIAGLIVYSIWIQITAVSLSWEAYPAGLPIENLPGEWGGGLNTIQYLRWVVIPSLWRLVPLDVIWSRTGEITWLVMFGLLALVSGVILALKLRDHPLLKANGRWLMLMPLVFIVCNWVGLRMVIHDELYGGKNNALFEMMSILERESQPGDLLLLSNNDYVPFFLNHNRLNHPRIVALADQPGEISAPDQAITVVPENADVLLERSTIPLLFSLAERYDTMWLLVDASQWIPWRVRPVERFMSQHYYPLREMATDPAVRVMEYALANAPDAYGFRLPDYESDLVFGDAIRLLGYSLPLGSEYTAGDILPVSFAWQAERSLERNFTIAWFLADANQAVVAQGMDSQPGGGFTPTSNWRIGVPVWDNRALRLPTNLQSGQYRLWIRLYASIDVNDVLLVKGEEIFNNTVGVLTNKIEVISK